MYKLELVYCVENGENALHALGSELPFDNVRVNATTMKEAAMKYKVGVVVEEFIGESVGHPDFLITGEEQDVRDFVSFLLFNEPTEKTSKRKST